MELQNKRVKLRRILSVSWYLIMSILVCTATVIIAVCKWAKTTFNVGLDAIINTMFGQLEGTSMDTVVPAVQYCVPIVVGVILLWIIYIVADYIYKRKTVQQKTRKRIKVILSILMIFYFFGALAFVQISYDVVGYILAKYQDTKIFEENYVNPNEVIINATEESRNLLYIYLESMETTYASKDVGGKQKENYIPNLTKLAEDNISFSNTEQLGGFLPITGSTWTMGAIFTTTTGVPYCFPIGGNEMENEDNFATGVFSMGDFLNEQGYTQEFLCGSNANFAGRRKYFEQHGNYEIFDLYTAREKGYVDEDYYVWWGIEDFILYEIAKDELLRLSSEEEPFNLTMLTVDTHHIGGYVCDLCEDTYDDDTANVIACSDKQVTEFIEWCKQQEFYDNLTIVITGDHPRMDSCLVENLELEERPVYNCIINSVCDNKENTKNREFTAMDIFPTVLASMGYEIEGNKLGMGVNLFSEESTLIERLGFREVKREFGKSSSYYMEQFSPELNYLLEDEKTAFCNIRFGLLGNAAKYITSGVDNRTGWTNKKKVNFKISAKHGKKVHVIIHVDNTAAYHEYTVIQNKEQIYTGGQSGSGVIEFDVNVVDGISKFSITLSDTVDEFDEEGKIRKNAALKISKITMNYVEE